MKVKRIKKIIYSKDKENRTFKGSFTIEAAVVVPICMLIMLGAVYLTFYVHDRAVIYAVTDYKTLSGEQEDADKSLASSLINSSGISLSVSEGEEERQGNASAEFRMPLAFLYRLLDTDEGISAELKLSNLKGRPRLLLYKSICDGISDLTGTK